MGSLSPGAYWFRDEPPRDETQPQRFAKLDAHCQVDVVVIGAGICGLTAALHLKRAGKQVVVLDAQTIGAGTSGGNSGHLDMLPDQGVQQLINTCGVHQARQVTACRAQAIDQIEAWVHELSIDCDFRRIPATLYTEDAQSVSRLRRECEAALRLGLDASWRSQADSPFETAGAVQIAHQARFDPLRYLRGLAEAVDGGNGTVFEQTAAAEPPTDGRPCAVRANGQQILGTDIVLATHSAFLGLSMFDMRQAPFQSYCMAVRVAKLTACQRNESTEGVAVCIEFF